MAGTEQEPKTGLSDKEVVNLPCSCPRDIKVEFYRLVPEGQRSKVISRLLRAYVNKELKKRNAPSALEEKAV